MAKKLQYAIGVDIGGSNIRSALIDNLGRITDKIKTKTNIKKGKEIAVENIINSIKNIKENTKFKISGVGISFPGIVDEEGKVVYGGGTLYPMEKINLIKIVQEKTKIKNVIIENDANCFALAENKYGAGKKFKNMIGIIWGTGIGGGIIIENNIYKGAIGGAGELGHMIIDPTIKKGGKCHCNNRGCLEFLASGKNIERIYKENNGKLKNPTVSRIYSNYSKEKIAKSVIDNALDYFSIGIGNIINSLNPEAIIIGGGVSNLPADVYKKIRENVKKQVPKLLSKDVKILKYKISDDAGIIGAAALIF